jgi:hypothetical protein
MKKMANIELKTEEIYKNRTNVYIKIKASRGTGKESIVIATSLRAKVENVCIIISLIKFLTRFSQKWLNKDLIFLISDSRFDEKNNYLGDEKFLNSNIISKGKEKKIYKKKIFKKNKKR